MFEALALPGLTQPTFSSEAKVVVEGAIDARDTMDDSMADKAVALPSPAMPRAQSSMTLTEVAASAAARAFFYPSVLWNIARNRLQNDWAWWNQITEVSPCPSAVETG